MQYLTLFSNVFRYVSKSHQRLLPSSKISSKYPPNASKILARASQDPSKRLQERSTSAPRVPEMRPAAPKITQMHPRSHSRSSKKLARGSKKAPRGSQEPPRGPRQPCQSSQKLKNASQETPKASIFRLSSTIKLASLLAFPSISDSEHLQSSRLLSHFAS